MHTHIEEVYVRIDERTAEQIAFGERLHKGVIWALHAWRRVDMLELMKDEIRALAGKRDDLVRSHSASRMGADRGDKTSTTEKSSSQPATRHDVDKSDPPELFTLPPRASEVSRSSVVSPGVPTGHTTMPLGLKMSVRPFYRRAGANAFERDAQTMITAPLMRISSSPALR